MIRAFVDGLFNRFPLLRDLCLRWLPFASEGYNADAWKRYLADHPNCLDEIQRLADPLGQRYIRRLVSRKSKRRFICSFDEAVRYLAVLRTKVGYFFPSDGTMLRSVFAYRAGCCFFPREPDVGGRTVLDGGAASGDSSVALSEFRPRKVIAFEPSPVQREEIRAVLGRNHLADKIEVVPYALGEGRGTVRFADQHAKTYEAETISVDEFAKNLDVGLIKLDIEGAEFPTLKGAEETIRRCQPHLLICVYHNPEDLFEMPLWLHRKFPGYRFVFRDTEPANKGAGVHLVMVAWPQVSLSE